MYQELKILGKIIAMKTTLQLIHVKKRTVWPIILGCIILYILYGINVYAATITVDMSQTRQRIEGLGGTYVFNSLMGPVGKYNLDNLKPPFTRVGIDLPTWEPTNDNTDPRTFNWLAFKDTGYVHDVFLMMQNFKSRGISITASIWYTPDWMSTPWGSNSRHIPTSMYEEAIESISAFLVYARDKYGVTIDYVSFNEPNIGVDVSFSSTEYTDFIKLAGGRFAELGLSTKWLIGDTNTAYTLIDYATPILQDPIARQYLGPVAYHSWDPWSDDPVFSGIYNLAKQYNLPVWCTEVGAEPGAWLKDPPPFPTWNYAWKLAQIYYRVLIYSRATVSLYWEYSDDFPLIDSNTLTPYPAFYVVKHLVDNLPPGTDIVEANSDDGVLWPLAGKNISKNHFMVQVINTWSVDNVVTFHGLPNTTLTLQRTSDGENLKTIGTYQVTNGSLTISLPGKSISTLKGSLDGTGNSSPAVSITSPTNGSTFTAPANITISANASDSDGTISRVEFYQGSTKLGEDTTAPYSFTWGNAAAGSYQLTAKATDNSGAVTTSASINISVNSTQSQQTPFSGTPLAIPGTIQAEDFDKGGEGVAYHDTNDTLNQGGKYRTSEGADIETTVDTGGGYDIGWTKAGEWLEYTVNVSASGSYTIGVRAASDGIGGTFHVEFNGVDKTGTMTIPNTGGWQNWQMVNKTGVNLNSGQFVMRVAMDSEGATTNIGNFNYITVTLAPSADITPPVSPKGLTIK